MDRHAGYDRNKLFILSVIALLTAGMAFSIRTATLSAMQDHFFGVSNATHAAELITKAVGAAFIGGAISVFIGSPLCDYLGMGRLLFLASLCHIAGTVSILVVPVGPYAYTVLWIGMVTVGLAGGLVEAVINPLIATIYPADKTHKLNVLHAWWPGGIIIGGLLAFVLGKLGMGWQVKVATILLPAVVYAATLLGTKFPPTERVAAGFSLKDMLRELGVVGAFIVSVPVYFAAQKIIGFNQVVFYALIAVTTIAFGAYVGWAPGRPLYFVLFLSMMATAASELAPGQWVDASLTDRVGMQGILLLVYVSGLMFVMRHFAGSFAHRLSPIGLMWMSCLLASIGLYTLSIANSPITALLAATVWGVGVCYMWPTMLGITSERFPKGGAFLIGLTGSGGGLSIFLVLPQIGKIFDDAKVAAAQTQGYATFDALQNAAKNSPVAKGVLDMVKSQAYGKSFQSVAILPAVLLVVFGAWWLFDKSRGGYKQEHLQTDFDHAVAAQAEADRAKV